jgi:4-hydroxybenzoate polyprenyltransferase
MVVNDYYDAKLGRDVWKEKQKVLISGDVPLWLAKRFVTYLYSIALVIVCFLPGAPTRLSVTSGLMLTYLYTKHLKPLLLVKNVVCASLVALTPWTSGAAALFLTQGSTNIFAVPALWRLFLSLFFGVMGREIMLDCNDVIPDKEAGVKTLPLVYGRDFASGIALCTTMCMSAIALSQPVWELMSQMWSSSTTTTLWNVLKLSPVVARRLGFALTASVIMLWRSWQVYRTKGKDSTVNSTAVDESLITVVFLLASFV